MDTWRTNPDESLDVRPCRIKGCRARPRWRIEANEYVDVTCSRHLVPFLNEAVQDCAVLEVSDLEAYLMADQFDRYASVAHQMAIPIEAIQAALTDTYPEGVPVLRRPS